MTLTPETEAELRRIAERCNSPAALRARVAELEGERDEARGTALKSFCAALNTWLRVCIENEYLTDETAKVLHHAFRITIPKSNLLYRLLYLEQPLRTVKCPTHDGHWSGLDPCEHGCGSTGWLPAAPAAGGKGGK